MKTQIVLLSRNSSKTRNNENRLVS